MKYILLFALLLSTIVFSITACVEEILPDPVPTIPTKIVTADRCVVSDTTITLTVSGSDVNDDVAINYSYYLSADDGENYVCVGKSVASANVKLEPYTRYKWYAVAVTKGGKSEPTEVRSFYCVPSFEVETDNGDGEMAAVLRWKLGNKVKNVIVSATSDHEGYEIEPIEIPRGQDSCYVKYKNNLSDGTNNMYIHWYDDAHGIVPEPIIYDFTITANIQFSDTVISVSVKAKEIILDKQDNIRDHEFNVYRVQHYGNQTWLADDLRATSFINQKGEVVKLEEGRDFIYSTLPSGAKGVLYRVNRWQESVSSNTYRYTTGNLYEVWRSLGKIQFAPKGYVLPSDSDFLAVERSYGLKDISEEERYYQRPSYGPSFYIMPIEDDKNYDYYKERQQRGFDGEDTGIMLFLSSQYDWENGERILPHNWFNAKPWGVGGGETLKKTQCKGVCYLTTTSYKSTYYEYYAIRVLSNQSSGIARIFSYDENCSFVSMRCIKK
jgi:hypothetical protein